MKSNIEKAENKIINVCKKYKVAVDWDMRFPHYQGQDLPEELKQAIILLGKHRMKIIFKIKSLIAPPKPIKIVKK